MSAADQVILKSEVSAADQAVLKSKVRLVQQMTDFLYMGTLDPTLSKKQGHMEALNTVRRHATYIDGKMRSVTKYSSMLQYSARVIEQFLCYIFL